MRIIFAELTTNININQQIPFNQLQIGKEIGEGTYGRVCIGKWKETPVALKSFKIESNIDEFISETNLLLYFFYHSMIHSFCCCCCLLF
jgi:serine/threonine protein kinase